MFLVRCLVGLLCIVDIVVSAEMDFDDFNAGCSTGFELSDAYRSKGVIFDRAMPIADVAAVDPGQYNDFVNVGGTGPNALALNSAYGLSIEVTFVEPGTNIPTTTNYARILFYDADIGTTLGTIEAYDSNGAVIDSETASTPAYGGHYLQVAGKGIARVKLSVDADGAYLDNLFFNPPVIGSTPNPNHLLDIDANGTVDALTDDLLLVRHGLGLRGSRLTNGAVASNCQRCTDYAITTYLNKLHASPYTPRVQLWFYDRANATLGTLDTDTAAWSLHGSLPPPSPPFNAMAFSSDNTLFAHDELNREMYKIDMEKMEVLRLGPTGVGRIDSLVFREDHLFGIDIDRSKLVEIDPKTGQAQDIGDLGVPMFDTGLAVHPRTGVLYAVNGYTASLYTLDYVTGQANRIAGVSNNPSWSDISLAFDPVTEALFMGAGTTLFHLDPVTGNATVIGNLPIGPGRIAMRWEL